MKNAADKVEHYPIEKLIPYARNSRTHSDEQVSQIAASMKEWGITSAVLIDETGGIIAGHGRVMAAKKLGLQTMPVMVASGWTEAQKRAFLIADNKLAMNAGWDAEMLSLEIGELEDLGFDLSLTGFSDEELAAIEPEELKDGLKDEDDAPETQEEAITKTGDIWLLGNHRLICGDSTSIDAVGRLMETSKADCVWTDPPYGVAYVGKTKDALTIENDNINEEQLLDLLRSSLGNVFAFSKNGASWYVASPPGPLFYSFGTVLKELEIWRHTLVWVKSAFVLGRADYHYQHETIFYGWKPGASHKWTGDRKQSSTLSFDRPSRNSVHPTMKPVELVEYCISNNSNRGDLVLDPFCGSGSTIIACEKTNRVCRALELSPQYCDVIVKRWQDFTGKKATLESNGKTFDEAANG
jgi:DNA modification methylase